MELRAIIGGVVEEFDRSSPVRIEEVIARAVPRVMADDQARELLIREGLTRRVKQEITRRAAYGA